MRHQANLAYLAPRPEAWDSEEHSAPKLEQTDTPEPTSASDAAITQLRRWLATRENENLEFKEAKSNFHFEKLVKYCAALANEGGGSIVLGVGDKRPRRIVGSQAFSDLERTKAGLLERLRLRIEIQELNPPEGRVLVVTAPSRTLGVPVGIDGAYWMRAGEDLVPMTPDVLRRIFDELTPDYSAKICAGATMNALHPDAVRQFRERWHNVSKNDHLLHLSSKQLLRDAGLMVGSDITYAALILLGTSSALGKYLAQAETVFEYRSTEAPGPANQREEFRLGFLLFHDRLWNLVNLRNDLQHYLDRFVMHSVPTFREVSVREAVLNAVAHRDYREPGSIFVRQYSRRIEIVSPGGFPSGVSAENILDKQLPRNRLIADSLLRCGLVERSGQGVNRMLVEAVTDAKPLPDYSRSDGYEVFLQMRGEVEDGAFVKLLTHLPVEQKTLLLSRHYLVLHLVRSNQRITRSCRAELELLRSLDIVRRGGRGQIARHVFNENLYGQTYATRAPMAGHETNRALVLEYINRHAADGAKFEDLRGLLPGLSQHQVQRLVRDLKSVGLLLSRGMTKGARWFPVSMGDQT